MSKKWIEELIKLLMKSNLDTEDIKSVIELKEKYIPNKLYRYRSFNNNSMNNLKFNTEWFSNANNFNDPYDSSLSYLGFENEFMKNVMRRGMKDLLDKGDVVNYGRFVDLCEHSDPLKEFLVRYCQMDGCNISNNESDEIYLEIKNNISTELKNRSDKFNISNRQSYKICCFSEKIDSLLMWSHYTSNHTGFVVEYNFQELSSSDIYKRLLWPVIYDRKLLDGSFMFNNFGNIERISNIFLGTIAAIHKAYEWRYEKEWRLVLPFEPTDQERNNHIAKPKGVYLGSNMKKENQDLLIKIIREQKIPIYRMDLSKTVFRMVASPLE